MTWATMYEPSLIDPVPIRGRMAFGVTCLQRVCGAWGIDDLKMCRLLDRLWAFVEQERLDLWDADITAALPRAARVDEPRAYATAFGFDHLDAARRDFLHRLIRQVLRVGQANLYGGFRNELTREPTFEVAVMLHSYLIPVPDIARFRQPYASDGVGWGYPCSREAFNETRPA